VRESHTELERSIGMLAAAGIVVANMIGAGIFTTTGFQAADLGDPVTIYALWVVGGLLALCGALCYGELGAAIPRAGGEYVYLREAFGGSFAFMSALVSLTAGFSAPIASALKSLGHYLAHFVPGLSDRAVLGALSGIDLLAIALAWGLVAVHCWRTNFGISLTGVLTILKVGGIVLLVLGAIAIGNGEAANITRASATAARSGPALWSAMGTSLIFVMFCYSGWNSASYLAGEIREPGRNLPRALLIGTVLVMGLYFALNLVYFYGADVDQLAGKVEVALVAATGLFGPVGAAAVTSVLVISLLASASAMTAVGPRVYYALGRDFPPLGFLARVSPARGTPTISLVLQGVTTSLLIVLGRVDQIQQYAGFTLSLMATLAVASVMVLRIRRPALERPFRAWGYPATPLFFVGVSLWMMFWAFQGRPAESALGLLTVAAGGVIHFAMMRRRQI
jgi:APA family basic amino acid/polyamine antiporter